jgi:hypothetical protein
MKPRARLSACFLVVLACSTLLGDGWSAAPAAQGQRIQRPAIPRVAARRPDQVGPPAQPVIIQAGKIRRMPNLRAGSPYLAKQFGGDWAPPLTIVEVDYWNNAYRYLATGGENRGPAPLGVDQLTVTIDPARKDFSVNFRYSTGDPRAVGMIWQISRFPFANDPANWKRVPGLVATGSVTDDHADSDGYRYFRINFSRVASHEPGASPYFEGTATRDTQTKVVGPVTVIPKVASGTADRRRQLVIPDATARQRDRAVAGPVRPGATPPRRTTAPDPVNRDQTFYVRVVPTRAGGAAGIPAIPVEVTVRRPRPCPTTTSDIVVRPPSARIVWYMRPNFYDSKDADGRWHVVNQNPFYLLGAHMKDPDPKPEDKAWYEKVIDAFKSALNYFSDMMTAMSEALDALENMYVEAYAKYLSYAFTGGLFRCDESDICKGIVKSGLQATMVMAGIPPTLPTGPELLSLSKEYLVELGADAFGAGQLYDAYQSLPPEVKDGLKSGGRKITEDFAQSAADGRQAALDKYLCYDVPDPMSNTMPRGTKKYCTPRIPDPIFNSAHPATVMVWVENTNSAPTQRMLLSVTDSMRLYTAATAVVPELAPGQGLSIPVILNEDTKQFMDYNGGKCPSIDVVTISGELPCPMLAWYDKFFQSATGESGPKAPDIFRATFTIGSGASTLNGIDAQSANRPLSTIIVPDSAAAGGFCTISGAVRFPPGWQIQTPTRSVIPDRWDNLFTGPGPEGNPANGMLRQK